MRTYNFPESFWNNVDLGAHCWRWRGNSDRDGYGRFWVRDPDGIRRLKPARKVVWELKRGPVPRGRLVFGLCPDRLCVNPDHLFLGIRGETWQGKARLVEKGKGRVPARGTSFVEFWQRWGPKEMFATAHSRALEGFVVPAPPPPPGWVPIPTPTTTSPLGLVQERIRGEPWRLVLTCSLLNRTWARKALPVADRLIQLCPTPVEMAKLEPKDLIPILKCLGLQNKRSKSLIRMAKAWVRNGEEVPSVGSLYSIPGVGRYCLDSYRIFVEGKIDSNAPLSEDKELVGYCKWARARVSEPKRDPIEVLEGDPMADLLADVLGKPHGEA